MGHKDDEDVVIVYAGIVASAFFCGLLFFDGLECFLCFFFPG